MGGSEGREGRREGHTWPASLIATMMPPFSLSLASSLLTSRELRRGPWLLPPVRGKRGSASEAADSTRETSRRFGAGRMAALCGRGGCSAGSRQRQCFSYRLVGSDLGEACATTVDNEWQVVT